MDRSKELIDMLKQHIALGLTEDEIENINAELRSIFYLPATACKSCGVKITNLIDGLCGTCLCQKAC